MSQAPQGDDLQNKYNQLLTHYSRAVWTSIVSLTGLTATLIYSKYQVFRKQRIIDEKDNLIQNQKDQFTHLQHETKQMNKELAEEFKTILKNLKQNIVNDSSMQNLSNSLKTQINSTFDQINGALHVKLDSLKNYNYKEAVEKWYMENIMGTSGLKFDRLRRIQIIEAHWQHPNPSALKEGYALLESGYRWKKDTNPSSIENQYKAQYTKMREYFEKKNSYESKGVEINANVDNLGDTFGNYKLLQLKYRCWGFDIKNASFTIPLYTKNSASNTLEQQKVKMMAQGKQSYIECSDSQWFRKQ